MTIKYFDGGYTQTFPDRIEVWVWKGNMLCLKERRLINSVQEMEN